MGNGPSEDSKRDLNSSLGTRITIGAVAIKGPHGRYLSWSPGGGMRANEERRSTEETFLFILYPEKMKVVFGRPLGNGLFAYMRVAENKQRKVDAEGDFGRHGGILWDPVLHGDGKFSFKSVWGKWLSAEPPTHGDPQVQGDRGECSDWERFTLEPVDEMPDFRNYFISVGLPF